MDLVVWARMWLYVCVCAYRPFNSGLVWFSELCAPLCVVNVSHIIRALVFLPRAQLFSLSFPRYLSLSFSVYECVMNVKRINYATEKRQMHGKALCCCHCCYSAIFVKTLFGLCSFWDLITLLLIVLAFVSYWLSLFSLLNLLQHENTHTRME